MPFANAIFGKACRAKIAAGVCDADCCEPIPLPLNLWAAYEHLITVPYRHMIKDQKVYALTPDATCVFVSPVNKACMVYEQRPAWCRGFGNGMQRTLCCPYLTPEAEDRKRSDRRSILREREKRYEQMARGYRLQRLAVNVKEEEKGANNGATENNGPDS